SATSASVAATLSAVGSPRATSSAKLGPETTPTGAGHSGSTARCGSFTPGLAAVETKPLHSQTSGAELSLRAASTTSTSAASGVVITTSDASATAAWRRTPTEIDSGRDVPGR